MVAETDAEGSYLQNMDFDNLQVYPSSKEPDTLIIGEPIRVAERQKKS